MAVQSFEVPGYSGRAVAVDAGERIRITDLEGAQIGDLFALSRDDHTEYLSTAVTRLVDLTLFPRVGEAFYSTRHRPILTFVEDHSPGMHDMLFAPCDLELYESRGMHAHPNCRDNYLAAAGAIGIDHGIVPDPVNIFQNTPVQTDGTLALNTTATSAGDHVVLRAEIDCIVILTACSSERLNNGVSTPMCLEVLEP